MSFISELEILKDAVKDQTNLQEFMRRRNACSEHLYQRADEIAELVKAAEKVHTRWQTPTWKEAEPTAIVMNELRDALANLNKEKS